MKVNFENLALTNNARLVAHRQSIKWRNKWWDFRVFSPEPRSIISLKLKIGFLRREASRNFF
jgi:hypothetical protein